MKKNKNNNAIMKRQLVEAIDYTQKIKYSLNDYSKKLDLLYLNKKISKINYEKTKKDIFKKQSLKQWNIYYDDCIKYYNQELKQYRFVFSKFSIFIFLFLLFGITLLGINTYTGFSTYANQSLNAEEIFSIDEDYITILDTTINLNFTYPTPDNNTISQNSSYEFNVSLDSSSALRNFTWIWNGTNSSLYDDYLILMMNFENYSSLGEGSSNIIDLSRYGNNGTVNNAALNSSGKYGNCRNFNSGSTDYVSIADSNSLDLGTNTLTLSAWIYPRSLASYQLIVGKQASSCAEPYYVYQFESFNGNSIAFKLSTGGTPRSTASVTGLSLNNWYHLTGTYDGSDMKLYLNGILFSNTSKTGAITISTGNFVMGRFLTCGGGDQFNGLVDEVRVWNRSFNAAEVFELYNSNLQKNNASHWQFYSTKSLIINNYTYSAFALSSDNSSFSTETRSLSRISYPIFLNFTYPTLDNNTISQNSSYEFNVTINTNASLNNFTWTWNGTNSSLYESNLLLMYNLDNNRNIGEEVTNRTVDVSKYSYNGTCTNMGSSCNWTTGKFGNGINLDGSGGYIATNFNLSYIATNNWAFVAWVKGYNPTASWGWLFGESTGNTFIFGKQNGENALHVNLNGCDSRSTIGGTNIFDSTWHHVALVDTNGVLSVYVDGQQKDSWETDCTPTPTAGATMWLGKRSSGQFWSGGIDEVRIYNRSLSAAEISQQYSSNLKKYNATQWIFYTTHNNLFPGNYSYLASAFNIDNYYSSTLTRIISKIPYLILLNFVAPTPDNNTISQNSSYEFNVTIDTNASLNNFTWTWNGTNYTFYDKNLILLFNFNNNSFIGEGPNKTVDVSRYSYNGTCTNMGSSCNWTTGKYNFGIFFDGSNDYIITNFTLSSLTTNTWALTAWVKGTNTTASWGWIFGESNGNQFTFGQQNGANALHVNLNGCDLRSSITGTNIFDSTWHHVALIDTKGVLSVYVDGQQKDSWETDCTPTPTAGATMWLGRNQYSQYWAGGIDEVQVYNRSLSSNEIFQLYSANIQKYNATQWNFYINESNISYGNYTYVMNASNIDNSISATEIRSITRLLDNLTIPTNITIGDIGLSNVTNISGTVNLVCSGSTDSYNHTITYFIGASNYSAIGAIGTNLTNIAASSEGGVAGACYSHYSKSSINDNNSATFDDSYNGCGTNPEWWSINWTTNKTISNITFYENAFSDGWITSYYIDYWTGTGYANVTNLIKTPSSMLANGNDGWYNATFDNVTTTSIRLRPYQGGSNTFTGLWELKAFTPIFSNVNQYTDIGNHTLGNSFSWNTNQYASTIYSKFRCQAIDYNGTNTFTNYLTLNSNVTINSEPSIVGITLDDNSIAFGSGHYDPSCTSDYGLLNSNTSNDCWINTSTYPTSADVHLITNNGTVNVNVSSYVVLTDAEQVFCGSSQGCALTNIARIAIISQDNEIGSCSGLDSYGILTSHNSNSTRAVCDSLSSSDLSDQIKTFIELFSPKDSNPGEKSITIVYEAIAV